jgi:hypothetical protein
MSNPMKGQAEFRGKKLEMDFARFIRLEDLTGKKMPELIFEFGRGLGLSDLRFWFEAFLVEETSEADIGALIHQGAMMQDYDAALKAMSKLMDGFFGTKKANPPKAG